MKLATLFLALLMLTSSALAEETAILRGLNYLSSAGENWIERRGCVSCHQIPALIGAYEAASIAGIEVTDSKLDQWKSWSTDVVNFVKPPQKADCDRIATMQGNIDTMTALLLAIPKTTSLTWRDEFAQALLSNQNEDGSWNACGQLPMQRRPEAETQGVTTLWTTLALMKEGADFDREKSVNFADKIGAPISTEWVAVRLLIAHEQDETNRGVWTDKLLSHQNEDGGWGWILGEPSDAFGTSLALLALSEASPATEAIQKARDYLLQSQTPSGKWLVPGTKTSANGKPTPTANDWGTAFAVLALLRSQ